MVHTRLDHHGTSVTTTPTTLLARAADADAADANAAPVLLEAIADDPLESDDVYGAGDTVTLHFDRPTDRGGSGISGGRSFVDSLFSFSEELAYDYQGEWLQDEFGNRSDMSFRITILQPTCPGCTPMLNAATVRPRADSAIRTRAHTSERASESSPALAGGYGKTAGPAIVRFEANDFDNGDSVYGAGDTLTVEFDIATDRGGDATAADGTVDDVYSLLDFSHSLGGALSARWVDESTLTIAVRDADGAEPLVSRTTVRPKSAAVRNSGCCAAYDPEACARAAGCCCRDARNASAVILTGHFGSALPPEVESVIGSDPDNGDATYGAGDELLVRFGMPTNRANGAPSGNKAWVDNLLWFSVPPGDDYEGEWVLDDSALRVRVLSAPTTLSTLAETAHGCAVGAAALCLGGVAPPAPLDMSAAYDAEARTRRMLVYPRGDGFDDDGDFGGIRNRAGSSRAAGTPVVVGGGAGRLDAPVIVRFSVDDPDNGDTVYGRGDQLRLVFDR